MINYMGKGYQLPIAKSLLLPSVDIEAIIKLKSNKIMRIGVLDNKNIDYNCSIDIIRYNNTRQGYVLRNTLKLAGFLFLLSADFTNSRV